MMLRKLGLFVLLLWVTLAAAPPRPIPPRRPSPGEGAASPSTPLAHSGEPVSPYAAAPACPDHDPRDFHTLWDARRGCHYNHTHGDDPHEVDDIFGRDVYAWAGGEISYPWQTPHENLHKHGGYMWLVRRDLPCGDGAAAGDGNRLCIVDFRAQFHGVGAAHGAVTNFHSAWLEARICAGSEGRCGIVRVGGWQGPVDLVVDRQRALDREGNGSHFFLHYYNTGNSAFGTWYTGAASGLYSVVPQFEDMWNTVPPLGSAEEIVAASEWFCSGAGDAPRYAGCEANSSRVQPHIIRFSIPSRMRGTVDPDGDWLANFDGYVDRFGELSPACRTLGPECVPFVLQNVPYAGEGVQYRGEVREYDLCFSDGGASVDDCRQGRPSGWVEYPIY